MLKTVEITAISNIPAPHAIPILAASHSVAAVVKPKTIGPFLKTVPAPMKPIPVTIWAAILAVSLTPVACSIITLSPSAKVGKPYIDKSVNTQAPKHTRICVLKPAYLLVSSRSNPSMKPIASATDSLIKKSMLNNSMNPSLIFIFYNNIIKNHNVNLLKLLFCIIYI